MGNALIRQEIADVMIYLVRLADRLDVDIEQAVMEKIEVNEKKYPVELSKSTAKKYNVKMSKDDFAFAFPEQIPKLMAEFEKVPLHKFTPCRFKAHDEIANAPAVVAICNL